MKLARPALPLILIGLCLSSAVAQAQPASHPAVVRSEFLYEKAPFPSVHASTIAETSDGQLVAAFFGGTDEGDPDVGIWLTRLVNGQWTAPVEVANGIQADGTRYPCWNPVLFQPRTGPMLLFYKVGPSPREWWGMLRPADADPVTVASTRLPNGILGPIKNKPIQLPNGDLLCPSSTEYNDSNSKGKDERVWQVHMERSSDLGKTWESTGPLNDGVEFQAIQPSLLILPDNTLLAVGRTRNQKTVFQIASKDQGRTWGPMSATMLPNPNSGTDAVTLKDGRQLIVYNHTRDRKRTPLNIAVSDDGQHWRSALVLEDEPGEYSYPAVIQTADGLVHVTYTWKREKVKHVVIDPARLQLTEFTDTKP
ncbi:sialidase family protein [Planctomicrobium sp. SH664]|uniref:sialidase family protein n=1 Tax=Planctomicrobium sp. SH664 TaxID=3448125 RepID=UPI003F5BBCD0